MKTWIGQRGNKDKPVKKVKDKQIVNCIKNNITCNSGNYGYVANMDNSQGLMSKVENGIGYFLDPRTKQWELI